MLSHSGFQFEINLRTTGDSMTTWFSLSTIWKYIKICPSKCQTASPCSFANHAFRRSHYALHFTEEWKPHQAKKLLNWCLSHVRFWPQNFQCIAWPTDEWAESKWPSWAGVCLDVPTEIVEQNPFTSPLRGWNLRMKFLYIPQDHS